LQPFQPDFLSVTNQPDLSKIKPKFAIFGTAPVIAFSILYSGGYSNEKQNNSA
jgi:hypothetical protein